MEKEVVTVGLDLAKNVFQIHAIGSDGEVVVRRKLRRVEVIRFFTDLRHAWSAWKPAHRRIPGGACLWLWAMRCG